ncbi:hypothetical protein [Larsenimonas rhizosphaerae]|uniref:Uncharacterized protein n=1 Tax=Larsenimonas rhizosphaerae TaxID=2944682 RepID=A0AA42CUH5_9GAMM|nr:hypothetical protein [Larsenimonas rhizosphaerae]MCX2524344.1 hypothetical protein [Larsenimonas rhizosphaerae]
MAAVKSRTRSEHVALVGLITGVAVLGILTAVPTVLLWLKLFS